jgi:hypothetical protein
MNIHEVINLTNEKKNRLKEAVKKIVELIHRKILEYAKQKKEACSYFIPMFVDDFPLQDRGYAIREVYNILNEEGYIVCAYESGQIDICWNETLVHKKLNKDKYLLKQEEERVERISRKNKAVHERFAFLANPSKISNKLTLEEKLDNKINEILKEKDHEQKQMAKKVGNFVKVSI